MSTVWKLAVACNEGPSMKLPLNCVMISFEYDRYCVVMRLDDMLSIRNLGPSEILIALEKVFEISHTNLIKSIYAVECIRLDDVHSI